MAVERVYGTIKATSSTQMKTELYDYFPDENGVKFYLKDSSLPTLDKYFFQRFKVTYKVLSSVLQISKIEVQIKETDNWYSTTWGIEKEAGTLKWENKWDFGDSGWTWRTSTGKIAYGSSTTSPKYYFHNKGAGVHTKGDYLNTENWGTIGYLVYPSTIQFSGREGTGGTIGAIALIPYMYEAFLMQTEDDWNLTKKQNYARLTLSCVIPELRAHNWFYKSESDKTPVDKKMDVEEDGYVKSPGACSISDQNGEIDLKITWSDNGGVGKESQTQQRSWKKTGKFVKWLAYKSKWGIRDSSSDINASTNISYKKDGDGTYNRYYLPEGEYGEASWGTAPTFKAPTVTRFGYKFKEWRLDDGAGELVPGGKYKFDSTIDGDSKIIGAVWTPLTYTVKLNTSFATEKWHDKPAYTFTDGNNTKVYDKNKTLEGNGDTLTRFGYNYKGWSLTKGGAKSIDPGAEVTDAMLGYTHGINNINLYSAWEPKKHYCDYYYFNPANTSGSQLHFEGSYTIETGTYLQYEPVISGLTINYAFLGWVTEEDFNKKLKDKWNDPAYVGNGYHGIYYNPNNISKDGLNRMLPHKVVTSSITEWKDGSRTKYYGLWSITGKFICTKSVKKNASGTVVEPAEWKKVACAYVKTDTGWKVIEKLYVDENDGINWKREFHK